MPWKHCNLKMPCFKTVHALLKMQIGCASSLTCDDHESFKVIFLYSQVTTTLKNSNSPGSHHSLSLIFSRTLRRMSLKMEAVFSILENSSQFNFPIISLILKKSGSFDLQNVTIECRLVDIKLFF